MRPLRTPDALKLCSCIKSVHCPERHLTQKKLLQSVISQPLIKHMLADDFFEQFFNQLKGLMPGASAASEEMKQYLQRATLATFEQFQLVTREEFAAQQAVLIRTREKLEALEKQVQELEENTSSK